MNVLDDLLGGAPPKPNTIHLYAVRVNGGTQMRAGLDDATVKEYYETLVAQGEGAAWPFPPIVVFHDGKEHWLGDGFHRLAAAKQSPVNFWLNNEIPADIRAGTRRDAILFAAQANASHGLRRSQADKRRAVETLLRDDEWRQWSDREIARKCNVSADLVGVVRKELYPPQPVTVGNDSEPEERTYTTKHGSTATMQTGNIGKAQPTAAPTWQIERVVSRVIEQTWPNAAPTQANINELRVAALTRGSAFLKSVETELDAANIEFRHSDLAHATINVANQMERGLNRQAAPQPEPEPAAWVPPGIPGARAAQHAAPTVTPGELPQDLAARGWELRRVGGVGKYYCNNANGPRATGVYDRAQDAIDEAYTMQVDLRAAPAAAGTPTPTAQLRSATSDGRAREHIANATADLLMAKNTIADSRPAAAETLERVLEMLRDVLQQWPGERL